jgi:dTDP-4-dehydrorhamnose 3,5-epimerase
MLSSEYNPSLEHEINPFDSEIGIDWPNMHKILSKKDLLGKKLKDRELDGTLPYGY